MSWKSRTQQATAELLWENEIVIVNFEAPFQLNSGAKSPLYLDCRRIPSLPTAFKQITSMLHELIERSAPAAMSPICVMGMESSGIPFATAIALSNHWPLCYVRKVAKDHGTNRMIEGIPTSQCALIDDVITSGKTREPALKTLEEASINVFVNAVIVDRRIKQTSDRILRSLTTLTTIIEHAPHHQAELWAWWHAQEPERAKEV